MPLVHHTKSKGDLGVAKVHADLAEQGFLVLFPSTEHAPFDLVAYDESGFVRLQVKYRAASRGSVTVHMRSAWSDRRGVHVRAIDPQEIDLIAVYCPDADHCYDVRASGCGRSVTLRITPSKNNQLMGVLPAERFRSAREPCDPGSQ